MHANWCHVEAMPVLPRVEQEEALVLALVLREAVQEIGTGANERNEWWSRRSRSTSYNQTQLGSLEIKQRGFTIECFEYR